jgi:hypothetical protein
MVCTSQTLAENGKFEMTNAEIFYEKLGCVCEMTDESILWNFRKRLSETPEMKTELVEALVFVGSERSSEFLVQEATTIHSFEAEPEAVRKTVQPATFTLEQAYEKLGASSEIDDYSLRVAHEFLCHESPNRKHEYDLALKSICLERKSEGLAAYCVELGILESNSSLVSAN